MRLRLLASSVREILCYLTHVALNAARDVVMICVCLLLSATSVYSQTDPAVVEGRFFPLMREPSARHIIAVVGEGVASPSSYLKMLSEGRKAGLTYQLIAAEQSDAGRAVVSYSPRSGGSEQVDRRPAPEGSVLDVVRGVLESALQQAPSGKDVIVVFAGHSNPRGVSVVAGSHAAESAGVDSKFLERLNFRGATVVFSGCAAAATCYPGYMYDEKIRHVPVRVEDSLVSAAIGKAKANQVLGWNVAADAGWRPLEFLMSGGDFSGADLSAFPQLRAFYDATFFKGSCSKIGNSFCNARQPLSPSAEVVGYISDTPLGSKLRSLSTIPQNTPITANQRRVIEQFFTLGGEVSVSSPPRGSENNVGQVVVTLFGQKGYAFPGFESVLGAMSSGVMDNLFDGSRLLGKDDYQRLFKSLTQLRTLALTYEGKIPADGVLTAFAYENYDLYRNLIAELGLPAATDPRTLTLAQVLQEGEKLLVRRTFGSYPELMDGYRRGAISGTTVRRYLEFVLGYGGGRWWNRGQLLRLPVKELVQLVTPENIRELNFLLTERDGLAGRSADLPTQTVRAMEQRDVGAIQKLVLQARQTMEASLGLAQARYISPVDANRPIQITRIADPPVLARQLHPLKEAQIQEITRRIKVYDAATGRAIISGSALLDSRWSDVVSSAERRESLSILRDTVERIAAAVRVVDAQGLQTIDRFLALDSGSAVAAIELSVVRRGSALDIKTITFSDAALSDLVRSQIRHPIGQQFAVRPPHSGFEVALQDPLKRMSSLPVEVSRRLRVAVYQQLYHDVTHHVISGERFQEVLRDLSGDPSLIVPPAVRRAVEEGTSSLEVSTEAMKASYAQERRTALNSQGMAPEEISRIIDSELSTLDRIGAAAPDMVAQARQREPAITAHLNTLIQERLSGYGARLEGLDHRIKTEKSLSRKLMTEATNRPAQGLPSQAALVDEMKDVVRYTMLLEPDGYVSGYETVLKELADRGYEPVKRKPSWAPKDSRYVGTNTNWRSPTGQAFEVQFHTPESFFGNKVTHPLYEVSRTLPSGHPDKGSFDLVSFQITNTIPRPSGAGDIKPFNRPVPVPVVDSSSVNSLGLEAQAARALMVGPGGADADFAAQMKILSELFGSNGWPAPLADRLSRLTPQAAAQFITQNAALIVDAARRSQHVALIQALAEYESRVSILTPRGSVSDRLSRLARDFGWSQAAVDALLKMPPSQIGVMLDRHFAAMDSFARVGDVTKIRLLVGQFDITRPGVLSEALFGQRALGGIPKALNVQGDVDLIAQVRDSLLRSPDLSKTQRWAMEAAFKEMARTGISLEERANLVNFLEYSRAGKKVSIPGQVFGQGVVVSGRDAVTRTAYLNWAGGEEHVDWKSPSKFYQLLLEANTIANLDGRRSPSDALRRGLEVTRGELGLLGSKISDTGVSARAERYSPTDFYQFLASYNEQAVQTPSVAKDIAARFSSDEGVAPKAIVATAWEPVIQAGQTSSVASENARAYVEMRDERNNLIFKGEVGPGFDFNNTAAFEVKVRNYHNNPTFPNLSAEVAAGGQLPINQWLQDATPGAATALQAKTAFNDARVADHINSWSTTTGSHPAGGALLPENLTSSYTAFQVHSGVEPGKGVFTEFTGYRVPPGAEGGNTFQQRLDAVMAAEMAFNRPASSFADIPSVDVRQAPASEVISMRGRALRGAAMGANLVLDYVAIDAAMFTYFQGGSTKEMAQAVARETVEQFQSPMFWGIVGMQSILEAGTASSVPFIASGSAVAAPVVTTAMASFGITTLGMNAAFAYRRAPEDRHNAFWDAALLPFDVMLGMSDSAADHAFLPFMLRGSGTSVQQARNDYYMYTFLREQDEVSPGEHLMRLFGVEPEPQVSVQNALDFIVAENETNPFLFESQTGEELQQFAESLLSVPQEQWEAKVNFRRDVNAIAMGDTNRDIVQYLSFQERMGSGQGTNLPSGSWMSDPVSTTGQQSGPLYFNPAPKEVNLANFQLLSLEGLNDPTLPRLDLNSDHGALERVVEVAADSQKLGVGITYPVAQERSMQDVVTDVAEAEDQDPAETDWWGSYPFYSNPFGEDGYDPSVWEDAADGSVNDSSGSAPWESGAWDDTTYQGGVELGGECIHPITGERIPC